MTAEWFDLSPETITKAPPDMRGWILVGQSMTVIVGRAAGVPVDVFVKRQEDGPLNADEQGFFPAGQPATLREVCLSARGVPLLVARTVFTSDILRDHPQIVHLAPALLARFCSRGQSRRVSPRASSVRSCRECPCMIWCAGVIRGRGPPIGGEGRCSGCSARPTRSSSCAR